MKGQRWLLHRLSLGLLLALMASLGAGAPEAVQADRPAAHLDIGRYGGLAIGVPYEDLSGTNEGSVNVLYGSSGGLTTAGSARFDQSMPGVPGSAENGDHFGSSLAV